jgi:GH15 family glucan-1,4-alpha-glucosidase
LTTNGGAAKQPPITDYGLIGDSRGAALVSRDGSIDWCCVPRLDSGACFARLLDVEGGGHCSISVRGDDARVEGREYVDESLVLRTVLRSAGGEATLLDCFTMPDLEGEDHRPEIARIVEGRRGTIEFALRIEPRFDYGGVDAWIRRHGKQTFSAIGGDDGLIIWSDLYLDLDGRHALAAVGAVRGDERLRVVLISCDPAELDAVIDSLQIDGQAVDERVEQTIAAWQGFAKQLRPRGPDPSGALRSAIVLCALTYRPTGAIVAAPTTSLPEVLGGERNWDYRFSWIRDSALAVRSLAELGYEEEAGALRQFVERAAAGNAKDLQVMFGIAGEHRIDEQQLEHLSGYAGSRPVRIGNQAKDQLQLDVLGQLVDQSWRWYERGHEPDDDYWRFLVDLVEAAIDQWREPDAGIWEWPGEPKHFVHSKVMCWAAVDRGLRLAEACMRKAPERRWRRARDEIREAVESEGYDSDRGTFIQAFGERGLDAALLRLPPVEFVSYDDERMVRTTDAIRDGLGWDGLLRRYDADDGLPGREAAFVACGFWLAEVLARQGRVLEARTAYDRSLATANGLGLFSEEYDPEAKLMLGNFPQALSHLSHLEAAIALADVEAEAPATAGGPKG